MLTKKPLEGKDRIEDERGATPPPPNSKKKGARVRTLLFVAQVLFVAGLLVWWVLSKAVRTSHSLWVLFFYSFPSEFMIAPVPHEPVVLYFGKLYSFLIVGAVAVMGTIITEAINYSSFRYASDWKIFRRVNQTKIVERMVRLFSKAPFAALWVAGLMPIPYSPFRLLVVVAEYPVWKYLLAVLTSKFPRFCLLALAAGAIRIPDGILIGLFVLLIVVPNFHFLKGLKQNRADK